jgi:DNA-binding transcriptional MerR regulator
MKELEQLRGQEFRGVEELAAAAGSLIEHYSKEPARGNVRLGITPRIVRHYLSEALLGTPTGHAGSAILFNYGNLLRLLAVKKLLADHWSVVKIREFMAALDIMALEQLVKGALTSSSEHAQAARKKADRNVENAQGFRVTQPLLKNSVQESTPTPSMSLATAPPLASLAMESAKRTERASAEWIEIATGLEIKVRRSFRPPRNETERERLAARFWSVVDKKKSGQ